jgi:branched-chain amino acid transport system ATP-binding protein
MSLLELDAVTSGYQRGNVVTDVSLAVEAGSIVALVGPNGHGKTTLLRAISGLLKVRSGDVRFEGKPIANLRPEAIARGGIAHVPQGDLLFPQMTVHENLLMGAYCEPNPHVVLERIRFVYALFPKLEALAAQVVRALSGGERRMVGLGRGLMADAKLMLIDEPSLGLAPLIIDQVYDAINTMRQDGKSILLVEENPERAASVADYLYLIDNGRIAWKGIQEDFLLNQNLLNTYLGL